jgi:hypothetical protein
MNTSGKLIIAGFALTMVLASGANAANQEEDSAYQWGRWAVLSPAAGGEPYVAPIMPTAANNIRPDENGGFVPEILEDIENPVDDPRDRLPPRTSDDPRDRLPPRPSEL